MDYLELYQGPLDPCKMGSEERKAYHIWGSQRGRNSRDYSSREFISWWLFNIAKKEWIDPTCGRIDHSKGYSFHNIEMQERVDNVKERNERLGNPGRSHKAVRSYTHGGKHLRSFRSKVEAAAFYKLDEKTIYNHCENKTKQHHTGPTTSARKVTFRWG